MDVFHQNTSVVLYIIGASLALLGLGVGYKCLRKQKKLSRVGVVSQLMVHPLKSAQAVQVETAECERMGLRHGDLRDRHWLIINERGQTMVVKTDPRLVLISLTCKNGLVCLNAPGMEELQVPLHQPKNAILNCRVFGVDVQGRDCGDEVSHWLNRLLDKPYRLVHYEAHCKHRVSAAVEPLFPKDEKVAYAYVAPILLLSMASLWDLNSRLDQGVSVTRFRPGIVVDGCEAYEEDSWDHIQLGEVELQRVIGCARCLVTTIDPDTGDINWKEPLNTLRTYRLRDPAKKTSPPIFGQYFTVKKTGVLRVGDPVYRITYGD